MIPHVHIDVAVWMLRSLSFLPEDWGSVGPSVSPIIKAGARIRTQACCALKLVLFPLQSPTGRRESPKPWCHQILFPNHSRNNSAFFGASHCLGEQCPPGDHGWAYVTVVGQATQGNSQEAHRALLNLTLWTFFVPLLMLLSYAWGLFPFFITHESITHPSESGHGPSALPDSSHFPPVLSSSHAYHLHTVAHSGDNLGMDLALFLASCASWMNSTGPSFSHLWIRIKIPTSRDHCERQAKQVNPLTALNTVPGIQRILST